MSVSIRPLHDDEWDVFLATVKVGYTNDMVRAGLAREVAEEKTETDFATLLPQRAETPDHFLFAVEDDGERAGWLWLGERRGEMGHVMFVYAIELDPDSRGRGIGRAAMQLAEEEARSRGIAKLALNVFGGNDVARGLYRSLGYAETAIHMEKPL